MSADMTYVDPAVVGVFDAGIGGIPLAARLAERGHEIVYLGDAARRPYGPQPPAAVARYVAEAEQFFAAAGCDVWVIACNTASVVAPDAVRGLLPCVDMVTAVTTLFGPTGSGPLGLIATAGTVASGAYLRVLSTYDLTQVATEDLLRLAEEGGRDSARVRELAAEAFAVLRRGGCSEVILACTDFTCVMDDLAAEAGELHLVDPLEAAVRLLDRHLLRLDRRRGHSGRPHPAQHRLVLTGEHPVDVVAYAQEEFSLELPDPEYLPLRPIPAIAHPANNYQA